MKLDDLNDALNGNVVSYSKVKMSEMANIIRFANIQLKMDRSSFDYYYVIDVDELVKSDMPTDELESLKKQGWAFSDDKKSLILYLKTD